MSARQPADRKPRADLVRNRARILDTALRHFAERGPGTSLEAIATDAGVGPATLYRHFPTREALLRAAQEHGTARPTVRGKDLFLAALFLAWTDNAPVDGDAPPTLRQLLETGYSTR